MSFLLFFPACVALGAISINETQAALADDCTAISTIAVGVASVSMTTESESDTAAASN
jgi:hypothetical protein